MQLGAPGQPGVTGRLYVESDPEIELELAMGVRVAEFLCAPEMLLNLRRIQILHVVQPMLLGRPGVSGERGLPHVVPGRRHVTATVRLLPVVVWAFALD